MLFRNPVGVVVSAAERRLKRSGGNLSVPSLDELSWLEFFRFLFGLVFDWSSIKLTKKEIISSPLLRVLLPKRRALLA